MNKFHSELEKLRKDAQSLHKQISDNIAKAEAATLDDVRAAKADTRALAAKMKALAADQSDTVKTGIVSAIHKMEVAVEDVEMHAIESIRHTNEALLDSARRAAQSLSHAVAEIRTKVPETKTKKVKS